MTHLQLYPLSFEPIFQYRLWGGRRLGGWMNKPLPDGPIGEAWILSDRDDHASEVAEGPLRGKTITELMAQAKAAPRRSRRSFRALSASFEIPRCARNAVGAGASKG